MNSRFKLGNALAVLQRTPATLDALLRGLGVEWTARNEGGESFSPFDVVGHLIDGEETDWLPRARIIRAQGANLTFEPYDRFRHRARNVGRELDALLTEFADLRQANLAELASWHLGEADLDLPGNHPALGRVTLRQLLAAWVVHDFGHLSQISRVMAKQYRNEVGPWTSYLMVLADRPQPPE